MQEAELSFPIKTKDLSDDAAVTAYFADGDSWVVAGWTAGRLQKNRPNSDSKLWTATQAETEHSLSIAQKADRKLLLVLNEQGRQVLQVDVSRFGSLPEMPAPDRAKIIPNEHGAKFEA